MAVYTVILEQWELIQNKLRDFTTVEKKTHVPSHVL